MGGRAPLQNLLVVLAFNLFIGTRIANVDNVAHIGGFVAGVVTMGLLEALPSGLRGRFSPQVLQAAALAVPFVAGIALVLVASGSAPAGPTCAGV
jgi:hypothetical protein